MFTNLEPEGSEGDFRITWTFNGSAPALQLSPPFQSKHVERFLYKRLTCIR